MTDSSANAVREIVRLDDPAWAEWQQIYMASFPPFERMSIGFFEKLLQETTTGDGSEKYIRFLPDPDNAQEVISIAFLDYEPEPRVASPWYFATKAGKRNGGYGKIIYDDTRERAKSLGAEVFVIEVEIPEVAAKTSAEEAEWARRRIGWYERLGAQLVPNIRYIQSVNSTDEKTQMALMTHNWTSFTDAEQFERLKGYYGSELERV